MSDDAAGLADRMCNVLLHIFFFVVTYADTLLCVSQTGAGSGIGRALAKQLSALGVRLSLCDINLAALKEVCLLLLTPSALVFC